MNGLQIFTAGVIAVSATLASVQKGHAQMNTASDAHHSHPYAGMWITEDGHVRHELLPNGRYVEARGSREGAYKGRYEVSGDHIEYWDDTGFTADGDFIDDVLHHGGMILYRDGQKPLR
jgi:hypothetical protein